MVLDASATLTWCFSDEDEKFGEELLDLVASVGAVVPAIWPLEITNAMVVAERRNRLTASDGNRFISLVQELPISIDGGSTTSAFGPTISLARDHELSSYDASYLELAIRLELPLATLDKQLGRAVKTLGVEAPL
jgi:predicted nucleic acid-binding protein